MTSLAANSADCQPPITRCWRTGPAHQAPPFERIKPEHFMPAYERAFAEHDAEIAAIAADPAPPTSTTPSRRWSAGRALARVDDVFGVLAGAAQQRRSCSRSSANSRRAARGTGTTSSSTQALFAPHRRADARARRARPDPPSRARAGALPRRCSSAPAPASTTAAKERLAAINERLATLGTTFSQNVLADEQAYTLGARRRSRPCRPARFRARGGAAAAEERGLDGKHVITLSRSSVEPFLQFSARRDLREKIFRAWIARGDNGGKTDNKAIIAETVRCAPSAPSCSAIRPSRTTGSTTPWRRRRRRCAACSTRSGRRRAARRSPTATRCRSSSPRRRQFQARRLGLALLRREAAQAAVRFRRERRSSPTSSSTA